MAGGGESNPENSQWRAMRMIQKVVDGRSWRFFLLVHDFHTLPVAS